VNCPVGTGDSWEFHLGGLGGPSDVQFCCLGLQLCKERCRQGERWKIYWNLCTRFCAVLGQQWWGDVGAFGPSMQVIEQQQGHQTCSPATATSATAGLRMCFISGFLNNRVRHT
jgi:hypothetical protein